jgi:penicillin-insensitive murein endopeptidase
MTTRLAIPLLLALAFLASTPNTANRSGTAGVVFAQAPAGPPADAAPPAAAPPPVLEEPPPIEAPTAPAPPAVVEPPAPAAPPVPDSKVQAPVQVPLPPKPPAAKVEQREARKLFGAVKLPSIGEAVAIGYYPKGCLAGGIELPVNGPTWQVMRLSRNRNWGHPNLVRYVKNFSARVAKTTGWPGILVGDLAQPRGGPMVSSHLSHQTGLDVDVWFMPMPDRELTRQEREEIPASNLVAPDWININPETWSPKYLDFIKAATQSSEVERVLVNAAIKKELCKIATGDRAWLSKVRPFYGHHDHIHVRLSCPAGSTNCKKQPPISGGEDCGKELDWWFSEKARTPRKPPLAYKPMLLSELPPACTTVLEAK